MKELLKALEKKKVEKTIKNLDLQKLNDFVKECYKPYKVEIPTEKIRLIKHNNPYDEFLTYYHGDLFLKVYNILKEVLSDVEILALELLPGCSSLFYYVITYDLNKIINSTIYKNAKRLNVVEPVIESQIVEKISNHYLFEIDKLEGRPDYIDLFYLSDNLLESLPKLIAKKALYEVIGKAHLILYLDKFYGDLEKQPYIKGWEELKIREQLRKVGMGEEEINEVVVKLPVTSGKIIDYLNTLKDDIEKIETIGIISWGGIKIAYDVAYSILKRDILEGKNLHFYHPSHYGELYENILKMLQRRIETHTCDDIIELYYTPVN